MCLFSHRKLVDLLSNVHNFDFPRSSTSPCVEFEQNVLVDTLAAKCQAHVCGGQISSLKSNSDAAMIKLSNIFLCSAIHPKLAKYPKLVYVSVSCVTVKNSHQVMLIVTISFTSSTDSVYDTGSPFVSFLKHLSCK